MEKVTESVVMTWKKIVRNKCYVVSKLGLRLTFLGFLVYSVVDVLVVRGPDV